MILDTYRILNSGLGWIRDTVRLEVHLFFRGVNVVCFCWKRVLLVKERYLSKFGTKKMWEWKIGDLLGPELHTSAQMNIFD